MHEKVQCRVHVKCARQGATKVREGCEKGTLQGARQGGRQGARGCTLGCIRVHGGYKRLTKQVSGKLSPQSMQVSGRLPSTKSGEVGKKVMRILVVIYKVVINPIIVGDVHY